MFKLIAGVILLIGFAVMLYLGSKRRGFVKSLFSFDMIVWLAAGLVCLVTAIVDLVNSNPS